MNKNKGITLIALVITIIILIILAGISVATLTGDNGLFSRAKQAKHETENAQEKSNTILNDYEDKIEQIVNENNVNDINQESTLITSVDFEISNIQDTKMDCIINTVVNNDSSILDYHIYVEEDGTTNRMAKVSDSNTVNIDGLKSQTSYNIYVIVCDIDGKFKRTKTKKVSTLSGPLLKIISAEKVAAYYSNNTATVEELTKYLFDGNIQNGGAYNGCLIGSGNMVIEASKNIRIYAYGQWYSDSAGGTGSNLIIQKYNGTSYENYKVVQTNDSGKRYELTTLEAGKYKLTAESPYVSFDEFEVEQMD